MATVIFAEEEDRIRAAFAEACFLLMREMRYGIGGCRECEGEIEVLGAKLEGFTQRRREDAEAQG